MNKVYLPDHDPSWIQFHLFRFTFFLLFAVLLCEVAGAQVNAYARVTNINPAKTTLSIANLNQQHGSFAAGRQVIVLQMQDNVIGNTGNNANFGSLSAINSAGLFEVSTIQTFSPSQIVLTGPLRNNYNTDGNSRVQVVSFNKLGNPDFSPDDDITALPWDGNTGGVIAFQVNGTLTLRRSIHADGAGFRGGEASNNEEVNCSTTPYITSSSDYGAKGEGIYRSTATGQSRGRAHILTGGGGGNGFNAGGAGGSNYTTGGDGGPGWDCNGAATGGLGGIALNTHIMTGNRVFMGGGGGGGQGNNDEQTDGGNGGGIIILKVNAIEAGFFNLGSITANGESSRDTRGSGNDGAGGAGAGGSILLQINSYNVSFLSRLVIQANGGSGGDVESPFPHGGGGGGGQGAILLSGGVPSSNITINTLNGQGGLNSSFFNAGRAGSGGGVDNAGIVPNVGTPLPVRLLYFAAEENENKTRLNWTATDELNTLFHVQHSTDGTHFTTIGTVNGSGKGTAVTNYVFTHPVPSPGVNFYRLEMIEAPDFKRYSSIATVSFNDLPDMPVAYPNPATDHFSVRIKDVTNNTSHAVSITDLAGKQVYAASLRPINNIITVQTGKQLVPGIYIVTVNTGTRSHLVKLAIR